jgi:hypothetical protein
MLKVIENKHIGRIIKLQKYFETLLEKCSDKKEEVIFKANREYQMTGYWNEGRQIIYPIGEHSISGRDKFWNVFGSSSVAPKYHEKYKIIVEINFPCDMNSKPHAKFAVDSDDSDKVFILHDGYIRVGKRTFNIFDCGFKGKVVEPEETELNKKYALVCQLTEVKNIFLNMLADFVYAVKDIRAKQEHKLS